MLERDVVGVPEILGYPRGERHKMPGALNKGCSEFDLIA